MQIKLNCLFEAEYGNVYAAEYENYKKTKTPTFLELGRWQNPKTKNILIGAIKLTNLENDEITEIRANLQDILAQKDLYTRYHKAKALIPKIIKKAYRTYNEIYLSSKSKGKLYTIDLDVTKVTKTVLQNAYRLARSKTQNTDNPINTIKQFNNLPPQDKRYWVIQSELLLSAERLQRIRSLKPRKPAEIEEPEETEEPEKPEKPEEPKKPTSTQFIKPKPEDIIPTDATPNIKGAKPIIKEPTISTQKPRKPSTTQPTPTKEPGREIPQAPSTQRIRPKTQTPQPQPIIPTTQPTITPPTKTQTPQAPETIKEIIPNVGPQPKGPAQEIEGKQAGIQNIKPEDAKEKD